MAAMPLLSWRTSPRRCIEDARLSVNPRHWLTWQCSVVFIAVCNKCVILISKWLTLNAAPCSFYFRFRNVKAGIYAAADILVWTWCRRETFQTIRNRTRVVETVAILLYCHISLYTCCLCFYWSKNVWKKIEKKEPSVAAVRSILLGHVSASAKFH